MQQYGGGMPQQFGGGMYGGMPMGMQQPQPGGDRKRFPHSAKALVATSRLKQVQPIARSVETSKEDNSERFRAAVKIQDFGLL